MLPHPSRLLAAVCLIAASLRAQLPQSNRVAAPQVSVPATRLAGHVPNWATAAADSGPADPSAPLRLTFVLSRSAERQAAFTALLHDQQDPTSPRYHQWLTPQQVGEQFGPTQSDLDALTAWLASAGLPGAEVSPSGVFVSVQTTAAAASAALSTSIHTFQAGARTRLAATQGPLIPGRFAALVQSVAGLSSESAEPAFHQGAPVPIPPGLLKSGASARTARTDYTYNSTNHFITPADFATMYDLPSSATLYVGIGQSIAIVGRSRVAATDIKQFESLLSPFQNNLPNVVLAGTTDPGLTGDGDQGEATLDVSRAVGTAPLAQVDLVIATAAEGGVSTAAKYAVNNLNDPILNISFGGCEVPGGQNSVNLWDTLFSQAASQGISVFVAAGDSGAAGCDSDGVAAPATQTASISDVCASSWVTCVGGTELIDSPANQYWLTYNGAYESSATNYIPEGAWNEPFGSAIGATGYVVLAGGGGSSLFIPKPSWQTGTGVPADSARDVPDISFPAAGHNAYYTCFASAGADCSNGYFGIFFGTSAGTPSMAGITAILNQRTGIRHGNLNPLLYQLAATPSKGVFHDATVASAGLSTCSTQSPSVCNNSTPGPTSLTGGLAGYALTPGFDLATGWGSIDVGKLLTAVGSSQEATYETFSTSGSRTGYPTTFSVHVQPEVGLALNAPITGSVLFYINGSPQGSAIPVGGSGIASITITYATDTSGSVAAYYSGDTNYQPSLINGSFSVSRLNPTLRITPGYSQLNPLQSQGFTVSVTPTAVPLTGTIQIQESGALNANLGSFPVSASPITIPASNFPIGETNVTATYSGDTNYDPETSSAAVFVFGFPVNLTLTAPASAAWPQTVTFSGTLSTPSTNAATPGGFIKLDVDGATVGTYTVTGDGAFSFPNIVLRPGNHSASVIYSGDSVFANTMSQTVSVAESGFSLAAPGSLSVSAGATTGNTGAITYYALAGFTGTITQSCTITPTSTTQPDFAPQCAFTPATVTFGAGVTSATTTLTFTTSSQPKAQTTHLAARSGASPRSGLRTASFTAIPATLLGALVLAARRRRTRLHLLEALFVVAASAGVASLAACSGSSSSGSPAPAPLSATYNVVVTGTSGPMVITANPLQLTVTH